MSRKIFFSIVLAIIIVLAVIVGGGIILYNYACDNGWWYGSLCPTKPLVKLDNNPLDTNEHKFSGTISEVNDGCMHDAICYIVIDGKKVVFGSGAVPSDGSKPIWGRIDRMPSVGEEVEVFAEKTEYGYYTLAGNENYYITQTK